MPVSRHKDWKQSSRNLPFFYRCQLDALFSLSLGSPQSFGHGFLSADVSNRPRVEVGDFLLMVISDQCQLGN